MQQFFLSNRFSWWLSISFRKFSYVEVFIIVLMYFQSELMIFEMDPSVVKFWIDSRHIIPTEMLLHSLLDYQINFECLVGLWEQNMLLMFADVFLYLTAVPWVLWIWYVIYVVHFSNFIQRTNYFYDLQNTNWTVRYGTLRFYVK